MKVSHSKFGIELSPTGLYIFDLVDKTKIAVDQVVFDATRMFGNVAEGYIVSVHGLPQDIAHVLPAKVLRDLGVGNHFSSQAFRVQPGLRRYRATADELKFENVAFRG